MDSIQSTLSAALPPYFTFTGTTSTTTATPPTTFPRFPRLPAELRLKIWSHALEGPRLLHFDMTAPQFPGDQPRLEPGFTLSRVTSAARALFDTCHESRHLVEEYEFPDPLLVHVWRRACGRELWPIGDMMDEDVVVSPHVCIRLDPDRRDAVYIDVPGVVLIPRRDNLRHAIQRPMRKLRHVVLRLPFLEVPAGARHAWHNELLGIMIQYLGLLAAFEDLETVCFAWFKFGRNVKTLAPGVDSMRVEGGEPCGEGIVRLCGPFMRARGKSCELEDHVNQFVEFLADQRDNLCEAPILKKLMITKSEVDRLIKVQYGVVYRE